MTWAILGVALLIAILLAGGPRELMLNCDEALRTAAEAVYRSWKSFTG